MLTDLQMQRIDETLMEMGWQYHSSCTCGGTLRKKYQNKAVPGYVVRIAPKRDQFDILLHASTAKAGKLIMGDNTNLVNALKELL